MKFFDRSIVLKIISVLASIALWLIITNSVDPYIDYTEKEINITFIGEDELNLKGLMIANRNSISNASAVLRGKRSSVINAMDNVVANIDLKTVTGAGTWKITPEFVVPASDVYIIKNKTPEIGIEIASIEEKSLEVEVVLENEENNESLIIEPVCNNNTVKIKGNGEELNKIKSACVYVDASEFNDVKKNVTRKYDIVFLNENNKKTNLHENISADRNNVEVVCNLFEKTELKCEYVLPDNMEDEYELEIPETVQDTVNVGLKKKIGIQSLKYIFSGDKITDDTDEYEFTLDAPEGLYIPEDKKTIKIKAKITKNNTDLSQMQKENNT